MAVRGTEAEKKHTANPLHGHVTAHVVDHVTGRAPGIDLVAGRTPNSVEREADPDIDHAHVHASLGHVLVHVQEGQDVSVGVDRGQGTDLPLPDVDAHLEAEKLLEITKEAAAQVTIVVAAALVTETVVDMTANAVVGQEVHQKRDLLRNLLPDLM